MLISFGAQNRRRAGLTASEMRMKRTVQSPVQWMSSVIGRAPRSASMMRHTSHSAGATAPAKAAIFSGDQQPDFSQRKGMVGDYPALGIEFSPYTQSLH